jgi:acetylornithine deacetylase/succinyl-diaminopimelate desuccinylase
MPSAPLSRVDAAIDAEELLAFARRLVAIPSYGPDHGWETGVAQAVEEFFRREGIPVSRQPVVDGRENVVARLPGRRDGRPMLLLNGHMDTVPPSSSMRYPAFAAEVRDGRLWGRGAVDMKGALAAMIAAFAALHRAGVRPPRPIVLAAVIGEETGGLGTAALGVNGPPAEMAVVGEPSGMAIIPAHRGAFRCDIVVHGRAAHGSTPELGVNAIVLAARLIAALDERLPVMWKDQRHPALGGPSVNIGTIRGGVAGNVVPDRCEFTFGKRWIPGDSPERICADLEAVIAATVGAERAEIRRDTGSGTMARPPLETPPDHPLVAALAAAIEEVSGRPARFGRFQAFTDGALLQAAGTPAVIFGPGDLALAHTDEEHVDVGALAPAARIYARLALHLCDAEQTAGSPEQ